jgi:hypothetical protein
MDFQLILAIFLCAGALVGSGLTFYAECTKLEALESYFSENKLVCDNKRFWGRNKHIDRFHRMLLITEILGMPKMHVRRGNVTEVELASVPLSLKRWALWPFNFGMVWIAGGILWTLLYGW